MPRDPPGRPGGRERLLLQRAQHPVRPAPLGHGHAQLRGHERRRVSGAEPVELGTRLPAQLLEVGEALRRQQRRTCDPALEQRVCPHGHPVHEALDPLRAGPGFSEHGVDRGEHALRLVPGVVGALAVVRRPPSSSAASVNVPPTSTPRSMLAAAALDLCDGDLEHLLPVALPVLRRGRCRIAEARRSGRSRRRLPRTAPGALCGIARVPGFGGVERTRSGWMASIIEVSHSPACNPPWPRGTPCSSTPTWATSKSRPRFVMATTSIPGSSGRASTAAASGAKFPPCVGRRTTRRKPPRARLETTSPTMPWKVASAQRDRAGERQVVRGAAEADGRGQEGVDLLGHQAGEVVADQRVGGQSHVWPVLLGGPERHNHGVAPGVDPVRISVQVSLSSSSAPISTPRSKACLRARIYRAGVRTWKCEGRPTRPPLASPCPQAPVSPSKPA